MQVLSIQRHGFQRNNRCAGSRGVWRWMKRLTSYSLTGCSNRRPFVRNSSGAREQLRARTIALVGRRRVLRQIGLAALILIAFGTGWATRTWIQSPPEMQTAGRPPQPSRPLDVGAIEQADDVIDLSEFVAQRSRLVPDVNSYEYWRNSGNRQLLDHDDLVGALRSYRRALNAATAAELQVADKKDTWLMSELKHDRQRNQQKELPHVNESL